MRFLDTLRQNLASLLLSDLGCPVWSCGSETDAWLDSVLQRDQVRQRITVRSTAERLLSNQSPISRVIQAQVDTPSTKTKHRRSTSAAPSPEKTQHHPQYPVNCVEASTLLHGEYPQSSTTLPRDEFPYKAAYQQLLNKFCRHSDPMLKLQALHELETLAVFHQRAHDLPFPFGTTAASNTKHQPKSEPASRRTSLHSASPGSLGGPVTAHPGRYAGFYETADGTPDEKAIVQLLKSILIESRPTTLFRDLQFISAFIPPEILNKTEKGKAFWHVGLAALALKDDVCRSMVDIAGQVITNDATKQQVSVNTKSDITLQDAAHFWIYAAREGNAAAQRELATMYLTHAELLPPVSLALSLPRDIFKSHNMYWQDDEGQEQRSQAMCLALHWMQQAASNGDEIAKSKLEERGKRSLR